MEALHLLCGNGTAAALDLPQEGNNDLMKFLRKREIKENTVGGGGSCISAKKQTTFRHLIASTKKIDQGNFVKMKG